LEKKEKIILDISTKNEVDIPIIIMRFTHKKIVLPYKDLVAQTGPNGRTYETPEGKRLTSITTVLGAKKKQSILEWRKRVGEKEANRISHHATTRGTAVHDMAERYLQNDENYLKGESMPHILFSWKTIKKVLDERVNNIFAQEVPLYSNTFRVAGRVDLIAEFDNKPSIIDFKTSLRIKTRDQIDSYFMQACAYSLMLEELTTIKIEDLTILMVVDNDPTPLIFQEKREDWIDPLIAEITDFYNNY
jgi:CRISPR/Cas system-associated exonuclease Cas4 (RecB family)